MKQKLFRLSILLTLVLAGFSSSCTRNRSSSSPSSEVTHSTSEEGSEESSVSSEKGTTSTESPGTSVTDDPSSSEPPSSDLSSNDPGTSDPGTSIPGTSDPGTSIPGTSEPGSSESGTSDPGSSEPGSSIPDEPGEEGLVGDWYGIGEAEVSVGHYFDVFKDVRVIATGGEDITSKIEVLGSVDYGELGTYTLTYRVSHAGREETKMRTVNVTNKTFVPYTKQKVQGAPRTVTLGGGSYRTGNEPNKGEFSRVMYQPVFIDEHLQDKPIPTNGWWTTLISQNYGGGNYNGGGNGIYLNPLRSSLGSKGIEITDVGAGWTQYGLAGIPPTEKTAHTFSTFFQDLMIKPSSLNASYVSMVNDYTDNNVKVALRNTKQGLDEAVVTYTQGSPYVFMEFRQKQTITIDLVVAGVVGGYNYYNVDGTVLSGENFNGQSFIIEIHNRHYGFGSYPYHNPALGAPLYKNSYFLVNLPATSSARLIHGTHADVTKRNRVELTLGSGNYVSIATMNSLSEASFYAKHGYSFMSTSNVKYNVNRATNVTETVFENNLHHVNSVRQSGVLAVLPHQQRISSNSYSSYTMKTVRGTLKMLESNRLVTKTNFSGVLPSFTLPTNSGFSSATLKAYLNDLDSRNIYDNIDDSGPGKPTDFVDSVVPYWNAKALYPLSQGVIMADQLGESSLKASFLDKIKNSLIDWFTYSGASDTRFIFYDEVWGSTYYSNNGFTTGSELSDHHFTHGYLVFASAVVAMYDSAFYATYKDIITFFLHDYASSSENSYYPVLRQFDHWAGHSWAHGLGFFTDGNNQESSGEALNGWVAAYLIGQQNQDDALIDAAIYGYTNELNAIKTYWFDYDENVFNEHYGSFTHVAGIVWGGKYDYATWFGANPTFIYGIHWIPTGEYNSSYALGAAEKAQFTKIFNKYWEMSGGPNTWYSNIWAMKSLVNSSGALSDFNENLIKNDDYPNELTFSYYMINAMNALVLHSEATYATITSGASSSVYETADGLVAMVWNPTNSAQTVTFKTGSNVIKTVTVPAHSFTSHTL